MAQYTRGDYVNKGATVIGDPIPKMVDRVKTWLAEGKNVRILTARVDDVTLARIEEGIEEETLDGDIRAAIKAWCVEHLGQELPVTNRKDGYMTALYDDRAKEVISNEGIVVCDTDNRTDVDNLDYKIRSYSVVRNDPSAWGAAATVYANEDYTHPNGYIQTERKKVAVFEVGIDADRYVKVHTDAIDEAHTQWLEQRTLLKLRALRLRVEGDIDDIEASVGNVPGGKLKRIIAAGHHYLTASGGQKFEQ